MHLSTTQTRWFVNEAGWFTACRMAAWDRDDAANCGAGRVNTRSTQIRTRGFETNQMSTFSSGMAFNWSELETVVEVCVTLMDKSSSRKYHHENYNTDGTGI
jgi:hypothetical protein